MQKVKAWKIWYSDSTFDSIQGKWEEAPEQDIQVVVFYFDEKDGLGRYMRRYMAGNDYYAFVPETEEITQSFDDISKVNGSIKYGKWTTDENIDRISKEAAIDYGEDWLFQKETKKDIVGEKGLFH